MEKSVFPDAKVRAAFQQVVVVKLFTDEKFGDEETYMRLREQAANLPFRGAELPQYVVINPLTEKAVDDWPYLQSQVSDPSTFAERLLQGLAAVRDENGW